MCIRDSAYIEVATSMYALLNVGKKLTDTKETSSPKITITISNSNRVKPFLINFFIM